MNGNDQKSCNEQVDALVCQGFLYARPVLEAITSAKQPLTEQWLIDCLDACSEVTEWKTGL